MSFANSLKQADIFFELTPTQLGLAAVLYQERRCQGSGMIFEENATRDELTIIAQGEVDIRIDPALVGGDDATNQGPVTIANLRRGQSFGEVALVDPGCGLPRPAGPPTTPSFWSSRAITHPVV
jgi:hypothetical protein